MEALLTIAATAVIQSIFGVGILLFGTPWMLLLGYDFTMTLQLLLPVSCTVSLLQVVRDREHIDLAVIRRIVVFTLPFLALFVVIATRVTLALDILVAGFVILTGLQNSSQTIKGITNRFVGPTPRFMSLMGAVHGLSNLGGSMLTALVYSTNPGPKAARATVATGYLLFALTQLGTLAFAASSWPRPTLLLAYPAVGAIVFAITERFVFTALPRRLFQRGLATLLLLTGGILLAKAFTPYL